MQQMVIELERKVNFSPPTRHCGGDNCWLTQKPPVKRAHCMTLLQQVSPVYRRHSVTSQWFVAPSPVSAPSLRHQSVVRHAVTSHLVFRRSVIIHILVITPPHRTMQPDSLWRLVSSREISYHKRQYIFRELSSK